MSKRLLTAAIALVLTVAACSDSPEAAVTTTTTSSTTTTTLVPTTNSTEAPSTTIAETTTTTSEDTTTTTEVSDESTTTTRVPLATTTTAPVPEEADPDLVRFAGLFRQPTVFTGFLEFDATGVIRAGTAPDDLPIEGTWDWDEDADEFTFTDFDFGTGCNGAAGRYARETAFGGGRRILLVDDPCQDRVDFITQPGSDCRCFVYLRVDTDDE